jgi:hypothetical protein
LENLSSFKDYHFWPRWTGTGSPLWPETTKNTDKKYETVAFKILNVRQGRTVIPNKQETNEAALQLSQLLA